MNFTQKSSVALIGKFFSSFLGLLISVLLSRYLSVSSVGQYQLIISTQVLIITVLAMGFGNASVFFINSKKVERRKIVSSLFKIFCFISFLLSTIFGISLYLFDSYFGNLNFFAILIFVIGSGSLLIFNILMPVLYASLEIIKIQVLSFSSALLFLIGINFANFYKVLDINYAIIYVGLGNILSTFILFYYLKKDIKFFIKIDIKLIRELFFYGIKISATNFVFILSSNSVIFFLKYFLEDDGFDSIGLFSRAASLANIFILLPTTLGPLFYSKWSSLSYEKINKDIEQVLRILVFITSITSIIIWFLGKYLILLLYGVNYLNAKPTLGILSISVIFSSIVIIFSNLFSSIGKPEVILRTFTISLIITFVSSIFLIPIYNIEGAAISILLGVVFNSIVLSYYCKKITNFSILNSIIIRKNDLNYLMKAIIN